MYELEMIGADLQDAFCHFPVMKEEVSNCICPGVRPNEFVMYTALLFGFKAALLLMARLASLISRFLQSLLLKGSLQTYMDDPLFILAGPMTRRFRNRTLVMILWRQCGVLQGRMSWTAHEAHHPSERMVKELLAKLIRDSALARSA